MKEKKKTKTQQRKEGNKTVYIGLIIPRIQDDILRGMKDQ